MTNDLRCRATRFNGWTAANPNIHHLAANYLPESGAEPVLASTTFESGIQGAAPIQHSPLFATVQRRDATLHACKSASTRMDFSFYQPAARTGHRVS